MAEKNVNAQINVEFEEAASRQSLDSGDSVNTLFGKIKKFFSDLKAVAFSGSYNDLSDKPESLPANGGNADTVGGLHVNEIASNPNLLINPDFRINQRGKSGTVTEAGYFVDRWQLVTGTVTINSDGTLTLNGTIKQMLENAVGSATTSSASAGTASYDDSTKTFTLTAAGETIAWAKLERGLIETPFVPPDTAAELVKCQRFYEVIKTVRTCMIIGVKSNYLQMPLLTHQPKRINSPTVLSDEAYFTRFSDNAGVFGAFVKKSFTGFYCSCNTVYGYITDEQVNAVDIGQPAYISDPINIYIDAEIY